MKDDVLRVIAESSGEKHQILGGLSEFFFSNHAEAIRT